MEYIKTQFEARFPNAVIKVVDVPEDEAIGVVVIGQDHDPFVYYSVAGSDDDEYHFVALGKGSIDFPFEQAD